MRKKKTRIKNADEDVNEVRVPVELLDMQPLDELAMGLIQSIRMQAEERGMRIRILKLN